MTELVVERLGHRGDGVAETGDGPVFVPFALPGERVDATVAGGRARDVRVLARSPDRVDPPCPHFGACGGCVLQHLAAAPQAAFKRQLVVDALAARGLHPEVAPTVAVPPASRRRATFAGLMAGNRPLVGFNERGSHRLVALAACPVSRPEILAALPALEAVTALVRPRKTALDLVVTVGPAGADVATGRLPARDVDRLRLDLVRIAGAHDLARLSVDGEVLVERRAPAVAIDGVAVVPPPGGFLQACEEGERALATIVTGAVAGARRVADLYAGIGTFAIRLARSAAVHAAEGDRAAAAALDRAARGLSGRGRISVETRDLARRPMVDGELDRFDAVVLDPPRAGAAEQSAWLARSKVPVVAAVSCNPATLARDLRTLVDGGYRIERVTPVDQFLWSAHVEAVAVLRRV